MSELGNLGNLAKALAAFQASLPTVQKGNTARIPGSNGKTGYSYDYADLTDVSAAILPLLGKQGLAWVTGLDTEDGNIYVDWMLIHGESGENLHGRVPVGRSGVDWRTLGGAITYARRYCLVSATGVAPGGDDNDGEGATAGAAPAPRQAPIRDTPAKPVQNLDASRDWKAEIVALATYQDAKVLYQEASRGAALGNVIEWEGVQRPLGDVIPEVGKALEQLEKEKAAEAASDEAAR